MKSYLLWSGHERRGVDKVVNIETSIICVSIETTVVLLVHHQQVVVKVPVFEFDLVLQLRNELLIGSSSSLVQQIELQSSQITKWILTQ